MNIMTEKPTKATSKARRRARRRESNAIIAGVSLAPIPRRERNGRAQRHTSEDRAAMDEQLIARCRQRGLEPTAENLRRMKSPWAVAPEAGAIEMEATEQGQQRLWTASQHMLKTWVAYHRAIGAPCPYPRCAGILAPTDATHADAASPPADLRTDQEKYNGAISAKMRVEGWLGCIAKSCGSEAKSVILSGNTCRDVAGLHAALRIIADGISGRL